MRLKREVEGEEGEANVVLTVEQHNSPNLMNLVLSIFITNTCAAASHTLSHTRTQYVYTICILKKTLNSDV